MNSVQFHPSGTCIAAGGTDSTVKVCWMDLSLGNIPYNKGGGAHGYQDPIWWLWLEFFSPLRGTICKRTHHMTCMSWCIFWLDIFKVTAAIAPALNFFRLTTLKGTKMAFLTPKRYNIDQAHSSFCNIGVLPTPMGIYIDQSSSLCGLQRHLETPWIWK